MNEDENGHGIPGAKMIGVVVAVGLVVLAVLYYGDKGGSMSAVDKAAMTPAEQAGVVSEVDRATIESARQAPAQ